MVVFPSEVMIIWCDIYIYIQKHVSLLIECREGKKMKRIFLKKIQTMLSKYIIWQHVIGFSLKVTRFHAHDLSSNPGNGEQCSRS